MIARRAPDGTVLLVRQVDHARLTRPLAEAWRWDVPRRDESARACGLHDDGWAEWDAAPTVDADGQPHTYRRVPDEEYAAVWRRGFSLAWDEGDWIGLLVSLHGTRFVERRDDAANRRLAAEERERERGALARLGHADARPPSDLPDDVERAFTLLSYLDGLSLFLCEGWSSPWSAEAPGETGPVTVKATRTDDGEVRLDPWPFREPSADIAIPAWRTRLGAFPGDGALRAAVASAPDERLAWRLAPP